MFNRREFVVGSSLAVIGGALRDIPLFAQQPQQAPPVAREFKMLRRNVSTFTGRGGVMGVLIAPDALVVADTQFADAAQVFLDEVKPKSSRRIDLILNSHHHPDHTGGNKVLRAAGQKIVAHENSAASQRRQAAAQKSEAAQAYPDETFKDTWKANVGNEVVSAKYYGPGHTGGDVAITFERANVVHLGDLLSHYRHPRADRGAGASVRNWVVALEGVVKDHGNDTLYIAGHSKPGAAMTVPRADVVLMRDYLSGVLDYVQKQIAAGKSVDEVKATKTLASFPQHEGDFSFLLQSTYEELTAKTS